MAKNIIITGTNTNVGKTIAVAGLACSLTKLNQKIHVIKPVQTGIATETPDVKTITRLTGLESVTQIYEYPDPLAPNLAAKLAQKPLANKKIILRKITEIQSDINLIEGSGGIAVSLGYNFNLTDLAQELNAKTILVTDCELGCLNITELTTYFLKSKQLDLIGIIIGSVPETLTTTIKLNIKQLPIIAQSVIIGMIPKGAGKFTKTQFTNLAPSWFDNNWLTKIIESK